MVLSEFYDLDLLRVLAENGGPNSAKLIIGRKEFPMKTRRKNLEYVGAVIQGEAMTLQDSNSDVSVHVPEGVRAVLWQRVYTEFSRFRGVVPKDECMVGPVVEIHVEELGEKQEAVRDHYKIKIPHCLTKKEQLSSIKVKSGNIYSKRKFVKLKTKKKNRNRSISYEVDEKYVTIHSTHFCQFVCSTSEQICKRSIMAFAYGSLKQLGQHSHVKVNVFLCSDLYRLPEFKRVCIIILLLTCPLLEYQPFTYYFN